MVFMRNLFDDNQYREQSTEIKKEVTSLDKLKNLEEKIATAIERVKTLKEDKVLLERRIKELEVLLNEKNLEVEQIKSEKNTIKNQIEGLLNELDTLEVE